MPNKNNMMFSSGGGNGKGDIKKFAVILVSCVLAVLVISILAILSKYDFDVKTAVGGDSVTEESTDAGETEKEEITAEKTWFFWVSDSENDRMRTAWIVKAKLPERELTVMPVKPSTHIGYDSRSLSVEEIRHSFGESKLVFALEREYGIKIDGYIGSDDDGFKSMINYFGGVTVTVPEQIEYRGDDLTLILVKGKQNMKGDTLLKYIRYLDTLGERGMSFQASVMTEIFESVFTPSLVSRAERVYSNISNALETNITIVDFSSVREAVEAMAEKGFKVKRVAETPQEFLDED